MASLVEYGSSDDDAAPAAAAAAEHPAKRVHVAPPVATPATVSMALVNIAPPVVPKVHENSFFFFFFNCSPLPNKAGSSDMRRINPKSKEIFYNPTVDELYAPQVRFLCKQRCEK